MKYEKKEFQIGELNGLSKKQIDAHLGLYAGYVKNVNAIFTKLEDYKKDVEMNAVAIAELSRRFSFEFNGMRLHEYYFEQFETGGDESSNLKQALEKQYGSFEAWMDGFKRIGKLRGIGWALLVKDDRDGNLHNVWVSDHEIGHLGGQKVLLAMDVWEHAFMVDYLPSERGEYIEAFFKNLNWSVVEGRN